MDTDMSDKMRYSEAPEWAYRGNHPIVFRLTLEQVNAAIKKSPSFKSDRIAKYFFGLRGRGEWTQDAVNIWTYVRKRDGSAWLIADTSWVKRCFEMPPRVSSRIEELHNLVESW